ncbi:MAG TPA: isoleucine--tRNA ligase [Thermodesulfovibrionales bacterium]|nr:isoleucine--tRNA ligase [Thermodesulfovibrionales bacterium]
MDYKDTLNLPQTPFPMKANLAQREPEILRFWEEKKIYEKLLNQNAGKESYILHDGPPYANGHIHIGHALNKVLKDIIVRFKAMQGFYAPYIPGWDCHGLPIELQVDKNLGDKKDKVDILEKRKLCREYAAKFVDIQKEEFKRLGVAGDWDDPYLTMKNSYEGAIVGEFVKFVKGGYIYKGKKPVHWCPSCVTALAEAEVEYADKESPSVFVKFRIDEENLGRYFPSLKGRKVSVVIWTTTPWTLPANLALAFHADLDYVAVDDGNEVLIVAEGRVNALREKIGLKGDVVLTKRGEDIEGMEAEHPFIPRKSKAILGDFVSLEEGTGIVHIAPGHGEDDYEAGLTYGLDIFAPVDDHGKFTKQAGDLAGQFVFKANPLIIEILKEKGALIAEDKITHSYPHCWRCKKPVIFRATEQWFIAMGQNNLRENCLREIESVRWVPSWGKERISGMVSGRPDWCISRQRSWGVPITLLKCGDCGEIVKDEDVLDRVVGLVKAGGSDIWFTMNAEELLPQGYSCPKCGGKGFAKETDILDVWFDSGVSHAAVLTEDARLSWPADMYLEGSDQHRGWFQSSLIASVGTRGAAPYRTVLTHGFAVDGQGKKMSKSLGNVVAPQDIIKANGAEIVRLWVSAEDYRDDIKISKEIVDRLVEAYRKIRNTARFLLGNLADYDGGDYRGGMLEIDRWALSRLQGLVKKVTEAYEKFEFHQVYHSIHNFCIVDMSSFYLDILKDRLYTARRDSAERRAAQWVLHRILSVMTRLMAPVLTFTAEEIWGFIAGKKEESVFLSPFPVFDEDFYDTALEARWERLIAIRNAVNKALEIRRQERFIGNSLEAEVVLFLTGEDYRLLDSYRDFLTALFIVSGAQIENGPPSVEGAFESPDLPGVSVVVRRAAGGKCQRCWNWSTKVGTFGDAPELCERCYPVVAA